MSILDDGRPDHCVVCYKDLTKSQRYHKQQVCSKDCEIEIKRRLPEDRFWAKVDKNGPTPDYAGWTLGCCWVWNASLTPAGYGRFSSDASRGNKTFEDAHHFSYRIHFGDPGSLYVCHYCDLKPCVRPTHLWLGTATDNMQDAKAKGHVRKRGETCPHGHLWTPENIYVNSRGSWVCRTCYPAQKSNYVK